MDAAVRSSSWPGNTGEPRPLFHGQTALSLPRLEAPDSVEDANGCAAKSRSTMNEVLPRYQDAIYRYALHLIGRAAARSHPAYIPRSLLRRNRGLPTLLGGNRPNLGPSGSAYPT
jgi:hypothetical protein